jgi:acyl-CoA thioester hydrolase
MQQLIETYRGTVYPWHCDHMGHMNVMWYVSKFDEGTWNLFFEAGITPKYLRENNRGMAGLQQNITYKRELYAGDVVNVRSGVLEVRDKVVRFRHEMTNLENRETAATMELTVAHIDTAKRESCPFPAAIRGCLQGLMIEP